MPLPLLTSRLSNTPLDSGVYDALRDSIYHDVGAFFLPEVVVLLALLVMLTLGIFRRFDGKGTVHHMVAFGGMALALVLTLMQGFGGLGEASAAFVDFGFLPALNLAGADPAENAIGSMLAADGLSVFFRAFLLVCGLLTVWMGATAKEMKDRSMGEFYLLLLGSLVGMMLLSSANHFLVVYLAVEMMSLPSYCLVALRRKQRRATEASLKYMLFGSVASGAMVYGLSLAYGATGGLSFDMVAAGIPLADPISMGLGIFLFVIGLGYKMAIAPMHFWCPDAYEGAPTPVTAFLSVASKAAGFAVAVRFIYLAAGAGHAPGTQAFPWVEMLSTIAVLTMTIGNITAIRQTNIKRMLAYSSIAHAGYLMIGVTVIAGGQLVGNASAVAAGVTSVVIYLIAYMVTNYGAFATVVALENQDNDNEDLSVFRGLAKRNVWLAVFLFLILLSLLGVPPTFGFFGKLELLYAGIEMASVSPAITVVLIAAAINTAISAYYYFKIAREAFLVVPEHGSYRPFLMPWGTKLMVGGLSLATLVLFVGFGAIRSSTLVRESDNLLERGLGAHPLANKPQPEASDSSQTAKPANEPDARVARRDNR